MLFRTKVYVLRAVREQLPMYVHGEPAWYDIVTYFFGINAKNAAGATDIAVRAAENATDRDGSFIGGVVLEIQTKCISAEEIRGYEKYQLQPSSAPGIFYVSGVTYSDISTDEATGALESLKSIDGRARNVTS